MSVASLPDDVVLLIIDACDLLEKDRGKTLAALCRLAKRYKAAAERALYSRVKLRTHWEPQPVVPGTALHTLVQESRLRASVKSIILRIPDEHAQDPQVASLLEDLPNVEEILLCYRATQADAQVFPQNNVPASSKVILAAIPSQIQHLSLVTSCLLADDVATYVLGPSRPPALMTLRLGGAVGQGFKEFARTKSAWYADFERTMEEAGVELTTVG
ncbi:hypothetical protein JCM10450v2_006372 [Rhodotorula kratochvilovae]